MKSKAAGCGSISTVIFSIVVLCVSSVIIIITKKFISFIRGVVRAWPNIRDEAKYIQIQVHVVLFSTSFSIFVSVSF